MFGLGYLAATRAGRERYDQLQQIGRQLANQLPEQLQNAPDTSPRDRPQEAGGLTILSAGGAVTSTSLSKSLRVAS